MKASELIQQVRSSTQQLWDLYQLFLSSNGEEGLNCFTPDVLEQKLKRTDKEIVKQGIARGLYIEDANQYL